jgi:hypothetical protein
MNTNKAIKKHFQSKYELFNFQFESAFYGSDYNNNEE